MLAIIFSVLLCYLLTLQWAPATLKGLRQNFYRGVRVWISLLPLLAMMALVTLSAINVLLPVTQIKALEHWMNLEILLLNDGLSFLELIFLGLVGISALFRYGQLINLAFFVFILERIIVFNPEFSSTHAVSILLSALIILSLLGDFLPWHISRLSVKSSAYLIRDFSLVLLSIFALIALIMSFVWINVIQKAILVWFAQDQTMLTAVVFLMFSSVFAWMAIALGLKRLFVLPILSIILVLSLKASFHLAPYLLLIPIVLALCLALAACEKRQTTQWGIF